MVKGEISKNKPGDIHGWYHRQDEKTYFRKKIREADRRNNCWMIPLSVLEDVDILQLQSDARAYQIDKGLALLIGEEQREWLAVPVDEWHVISSLDELEARRIKALGVDWYHEIGQFLYSDTMKNLNLFVTERVKKGKIYPRPDHFFKAFEYTPYQEVRVVILGNHPLQAPEADGLAYSYDLPFGYNHEIEHIQLELQRTGNIKDRLFSPYNWAKQGVLMLNTNLSVDKDMEVSHELQGWEEFTKLVMMRLNALPKPVIFLFFGTWTTAYARYVTAGQHHKFTHLVDSAKFIGCDVFDTVNKLVVGEKINWGM
jgi:uracil-DNA glycosylase